MTQLATALLVKLTQPNSPSAQQNILSGQSSGVNPECIEMPPCTALDDTYLQRMTQQHRRIFVLNTSHLPMKITIVKPFELSNNNSHLIYTWNGTSAMTERC